MKKIFLFVFMLCFAHFVYAATYTIVKIDPYTTITNSNTFDNLNKARDYYVGQTGLRSYCTKNDNYKMTCDIKSSFNSTAGWRFFYMDHCTAYISGWGGASCSNVNSGNDGVKINCASGYSWDSTAKACLKSYTVKLKDDAETTQTTKGTKYTLNSELGSLNSQYGNTCSLSGTTITCSAQSGYFFSTARCQKRRKAWADSSNSSAYTKKCYDACSYCSGYPSSAQAQCWGNCASSHRDAPTRYYLTDTSETVSGCGSDSSYLGKDTNGVKCIRK